MASSAVKLVPLTPSERTAFLKVEAIRYAESKSRAGVWAAEEAVARAQEEFRELLHGPSRLRGHGFYKGVEGSGQEIGWVWVGPVPGSEVNRRGGWLYQILVKEEFRGRGLGRALLLATEDRLRADGVASLSLNVWAFNDVARALYETSGYVTVGRYPAGAEMRKSLGPE